MSYRLSLPFLLCFRPFFISLSASFLLLPSFLHPSFPLLQPFLSLFLLYRQGRGILYTELLVFPVLCFFTLLSLPLLNTYLPTLSLVLQYSPKYYLYPTFLPFLHLFNYSYCWSPQSKFSTLLQQISLSHRLFSLCLTFTFCYMYVYLQ